MQEITNADRARAAEYALRAYAVFKEGGDELYDVPESVFIDLLCDLMHLAGSMNLEFEKRLRMARHHYLCETGAIDDC